MWDYGIQTGVNAGKEVLVTCRMTPSYPIDPLDVILPGVKGAAGTDAKGKVWLP